MEIIDFGNFELDQQQSGVALLREICRKFGFLYASYTHIEVSKNVVHVISTFPTEWRRHYINHNLMKADPIIRYGTNTIVPLDWAIFSNQPEYASFFKAAADFDVGSRALSIPVIGPQGGRGIVTVTGNHELNAWDALIASALSKLRHEAQTLHLMALETIDTAISFYDKPLSSDELKILRIVASGYTPKETSIRRDTSQRIIDIQMESIMTKLKSRSMAQAVGRAVATGLINWTELFTPTDTEVFNLNTTSKDTLPDVGD